MQPIIAIYKAYKKPTLLEVFCFTCHRLIGLTPLPQLAEMLRDTHKCSSGRCSEPAEAPGA